MKKLREIILESTLGPANRQEYFKFKSKGAERHARALHSLNIMPKKAHQKRKEARQHELRSKEPGGWGDSTPEEKQTRANYFRRENIGKKWFGDRRSHMTKLLLPSNTK